ncbi:MAG: alanyl-tRNA editing protein [Deltaproteobacteria bacterium]|nr:alanyl-tRNA editing protein [Deltaproteobacteria bacterium]
MSTELLYHRDPQLLRFDARVEAHGALGDRPTVILDRTAFYPEAGGQMADRGLLAGLAVSDVQIDERGRVHHQLDGERPAIGASVEGVVDRARRRQFMQLHTAQHLLSRALIEVAQAETLSARLGETGCTVDLSVKEIAERAVAEAEALSNQVIEDDLEVRAWFPTIEELERLPLRRKAKVEDNIRVVAIGDLDFSPCGGTHCLRTAQIGLVRVLGVERYKGMMRVSFDAGRRARGALAAEADVLRGLATAFTCGPLDVPTAVERLRRDLTALRDGAKRLSERAALEIARELAATAGEGIVIAAIEGGDKELMRLVASALTREGARAVVLGAEDAEGTQILSARGPESRFDCGALVKKVTGALGGKGGGRPERAEGRVPAGADWRAQARSLSLGAPW